MKDPGFYSTEDIVNRYISYKEKGYKENKIINLIWDELRLKKRTIKKIIESRSCLL